MSPPQLIAIEFCVRQILHGLQELNRFSRTWFSSPVRHAQLEQEDHWHHTVDRKRHKNGILGISVHLFQNKILPANITSMSGMLFLLFVQSLFQFWARRGNERAITGARGELL